MPLIGQFVSHEEGFVVLHPLVIDEAADPQRFVNERIE